MRKPRLYFPPQDPLADQLVIDQEVILNATQTHYVMNVLRCRCHDPVELFDGQGWCYQTRISHLEKKYTVLRVLSAPDDLRHLEAPLSIHLYQSLIKSDKMDWVIQKAIELGVSSITPIVTQYSDIQLVPARLRKKLDHWHNIMVSATSQSGRAVLAELTPPKIFLDSIHLSTNTSNINHTVNTIRLLLSPRGTAKLQQVILANPTVQIAANNISNQSTTIHLFIGPEGGFSLEEEQLAEKNQVTLLKLGPRILRTETAGLAVTAALLAHWGDYYD